MVLLFLQGSRGEAGEAAAEAVVAEAEAAGRVPAVAIEEEVVTKKTVVIDEMCIMMMMMAAAAVVMAISRRQGQAAPLWTRQHCFA